jgi:hypothetical protein
MTRVRSLLMAVSFVCSPTMLLAQDITGQASFYKKVPGTDSRIPVAYASIHDDICFRYRIYTRDGDHQEEIEVYDGAGRLVFKAESTFVAQGGEGTYSTCYRFDPMRDAPGTWWYVVALDGQVRLSRSLQVHR